MEQIGATLEHGGTGAKTGGNESRPQGAGIRFSYATGARPLDGYTIKRGVGAGGFGEVYYAVSDAGKEVAIKRIQRNLDVELRGVSQCLNLKHVNLLGLFDIRYDDQGQAWVIMEYVSGENLKDVIDRNPHGMPLDQVDRWFTEIAAGVSYLHDHGIVHRDLKPGNIFMDQDIVKIGDYGLAKFISCSRRSGHTESVGTFHYMAPEIGRGIYGKEIDIYSLGIILYEMLTGRVPFDGESSQEIIMKHLTADPDTSMLPVRYQRAIQRALFKDPTKRYSRVADMLRDLDFAKSRSVPQQHEAHPEHEVAFAQPVLGQIPPVDSRSNDICFGPVKVSQTTPNRSVPPQASPVLPTHFSFLDEPIAKGVRAGYDRTVAWWRDGQLTPPMKIAIIVAGALAVVFNAQWLFPAFFAVGAVYLIYFGIRSFAMAIQPNSPMRTPVRRNASAPNASAMNVTMPVAPVAPQYTQSAPTRPMQPPRHRHTPFREKPECWKTEARRLLKRKPLSERSSELTGAMLMSAVVASVISIAAMALGATPSGGAIVPSFGGSFVASLPAWTLFMWMASTITAATWVVLAIAKSWEGQDGDEVRRRFVMLVAGMAVGLFAFFLQDFLALKLGRDVSNYLLFFGAAFLIPRWWRQADPLRDSRLSVWSTLFCVLVAAMLCEAASFSDRVGVAVIAATSLAIQISSQCIPHAEREQIRQRVKQA